jgi:hypothetical protein
MKKTKENEGNFDYKTPGNYSLPIAIKPDSLLQNIRRRISDSGISETDIQDAINWTREKGVN